MSEWTQKPVAFAVRGMVKLPTAKDDEEGVGTGKADFAFDGDRQQGNQSAGRAVRLRRLHFPRRSRRRRLSERVPLGLRRRLPDAQEPARSPRNCTARSTSTTSVVHRHPALADRRGRLASAARHRRTIRRSNASIGLTWQGKQRLLRRRRRQLALRAWTAASEFGAFEDRDAATALGFQFRIGYHPGVRDLRAAAAAATAAAPPPHAANRPPTGRQGALRTRARWKSAGRRRSRADAQRSGSATR